MKKLGIMLAAALLVAAFAACGDKNKDDGLNGPTASSSSVSSEAPSGSEDAADAPSQSDGGDEGDTGDAPEENGVVAAIQDEKLKAAYEAAMGEFENWLAMPGAIGPEQLSEIYYVDADDVEEFAGEMSMMNISGDTFVAVKAKPGRAEAVAQALDKRRQDIISQFETYPVNFMGVKSQAAKVITEGDYVFLVLIGELEVADGEDATLEMAQAEVERAENAIRSVFVG